MSDCVTSRNELQHEQNRLSRLLCPLFLDPKEWSDLKLPRIDRSYMERLFHGTGFQDGQVGVSPESYRFIVETLHSTDAGADLCLSSDVDLLRKTHTSEMDTVHESPYGAVEALLPVHVEGRILWTVWTGPIFSAETISKDWADRIADQIESNSKPFEQFLTRYTPKSRLEIDTLFDHCRRVRDSLQAVLNTEIRNARLSEQLIQSERLRSLGTLSSGVAHHFNNLLSVILGYSSFIGNRESLTPQARQAIRRISDAAQKGRRLTDELLAFSIHDSADEAVLADVHDTLKNVVSLLQSQVSSRIQIEQDLSAEASEVEAPASLLHQIVFNLLTNAIDSMPEGGSLILATTNRTIGSDQTLYVSIAMTDTGDPIPRELQTDTGLTDRGQSTRDVLKLSSVYGMVEKLEGTVTVSSDSSGQNTVEVLLPVHAQPTSPPSEPTGKESIQSANIWVVDDDDIFREMCSQVLGEEGHRVTSLTSGPELMETIQGSTESPTLLIVDFSMPDFNGLEIRQWIDKEGIECPMVLVSGFAAHQPDIREALAYPRTHFLQKPFSVPELADIVNVALGESLL